MMDIWNYDICISHPSTFDICPNFLGKRNYVLKMVRTHLLIPCTQFFLRLPLKKSKPFASVPPLLNSFLSWQILDKGLVLFILTCSLQKWRLCVIPESSATWMTWMHNPRKSRLMPFYNIVHKNVQLNSDGKPL